jgi:Tfp pilus assembly protein PilV
MKRGVVLIEALLGVIVLSLGFLTLYYLLAPSLKNRHAGEQAIATAQLAKDIMATLRAQSLESSHSGQWTAFWDSLLQTNNPTLYLPGETNPANFIVANTQMIYRASTTNRFIVRVPTYIDPDTNLIPVLVQVWPGEAGPITANNAFTLYAEFDDPGGL